MVLLVFDIDCAASHRASGATTVVPAPDAWFSVEQKKLAALIQQHPGAYVYRTRGGYRVVYLLTVPRIVRDLESAAAWKTFYIRCVTYLARTFGIVADPACSDWTRLFRAPRATREPGQLPEEREHIGDPLNVGPWSYSPSADDLDADIEVASQIAASVKTWRGYAYGALIRLRRTAEVSRVPAANVRTTVVEMTGTTRPSDARIRRAMLYINRMPAAISGEGGHQATYKVALALVKGFGFPTEVALGLIVENYNPRCVPPWPVNELRRKVDDASRATRVPNGYLLGHPTKQLLASAMTSEMDTRPIIMISSDEHLVTEEAIAALGTSSRVFQRAETLVQVRPGDAVRNSSTTSFEPPRIDVLPAAGVREELARTAQWQRIDAKSGKSVNAHVPLWAVQETMARGAWPAVRRLRAVITNPVVLPSGAILTVPGYDASSALLYIPRGDFLDVPERPTPRDTSDAVALLEDVLADFPFASRSHFAAGIAAILNPFARHAYAGPAPLTLIDGSTPGSGKGLLADVVATIGYGAPMTLMPQAADAEEERKRILAVLLAGEPAVLIDNLSKPLGSAALDAALTGTTWSDRLLGESRTVRVPLGTLWYATGNNVQIVGDTARRVMTVRLQPQDESPELRSGFRHPDLRAHLVRHRAIYVRAALTILRAYFAAGSPALGMPAWGSFEAWSSVVRSAVVFAGLPDPGETRGARSGRVDAEFAAFEDLVVGWEELCQSDSKLKTGATTAEAVRTLQTNPQALVRLRDALALLTRTPPGGLPSAQGVGYVLRKFKDRVVGGRRLDQNLRKDRASWFVERVDQTASSVSQTDTQPSGPGELPVSDVCGSPPRPVAGGDGGDGGDASDKSIFDAYLRLISIQEDYDGGRQTSPPSPPSPPADETPSRLSPTVDGSES